MIYSTLLPLIHVNCMVLLSLPYYVIYVKNMFPMLKNNYFDYPLFPFDAVISVLSSFRSSKAGMT